MAKKQEALTSGVLVAGKHTVTRPIECCFCNYDGTFDTLPKGVSVELKPSMSGNSWIGETEDGRYINVTTEQGLKHLARGEW